MLRMAPSLISMGEALHYGILAFPAEAGRRREKRVDRGLCINFQRRKFHAKKRSEAS
ncbi:hypothetical protein HMPREF1992_00753 [Selenomonas sp. oral taxon 892 str. F0426]|nr:hypothetical protein HMPREF1992_00753 [Selenomonas sp. oral taxon 892 str. F0426]